MCQNELEVSFDGNETIGVTDLVVVRFPRPFVGFLLLNETPDLVALNIRDRDISDVLRHQSFAPLASGGDDLEDGAMMQPVGVGVCGIGSGKKLR